MPFKTIRKTLRGRLVVCDKYVQKKYNITRQELWQLIIDKKLRPLKNPTTIFFNMKSVKRYFEQNETEENAPIIINSQQLIEKFNLDRLEYAKLLSENKLHPLPIVGEPNHYFGVKEVSEFFANYRK